MHIDKLISKGSIRKHYSGWKLLGGCQDFVIRQSGAPIFHQSSKEAPSFHQILIINKSKIPQLIPYHTYGRVLNHYTHRRNSIITVILVVI